MRHQFLTLCSLAILAGCSGGGSGSSNSTGTNTGGGSSNASPAGGQVSARLVPPAPPGQPGTFRIERPALAPKQAEETVRPLAQPLVISLQTGWNMVSVPFVTLTSFSLSQPANVLACSRYNAASGQYQDLSFNQSALTNNNPFTGYWVYCSGPTEVTMDGPDTTASTLSTNLSVGWNLVGTPEPNSVNVANLNYGVGTLTDAFTSFQLWPGVLGYNPATLLYSEIGHPPTTLPVGKAQWIYAYQAGTLSRTGVTLTDSAVPDFSSASNPRGNWSYGDLNNFTSPNFTPYSVSVANVTQTVDGAAVTAGGLQGWAQSNPAPGNSGGEIVKNTTAGTLSYQQVQLPNDQLGLLPLAGTPDVRWTAPADGTYTVDGSFARVDVDPQSVNVRIFKNLTTTLHTIDDLQNSSNQGDFHFTLDLVAGDVIDFAARNQTGGGSHGATGFKASIVRNDPNALVFNVTAFDNPFGAQFGDAPNPGQPGFGALGGGRVAKFYDFNGAPSGAFFTFPSVVLNSPAPNQSTGAIPNADGYLRSAGSEFVDDYRGLAGNFYTAPYLSFGLVGVFTNPSTIDSNTPPARYDFSLAGESIETNSPLLNQVFFIGDGLTGTGTGTLQQFIIPPGATRLTIGFPDSAFGNSPPSGYQDNSGSLTATMDFHPIVGAKVIRP